GGREMNFEMRPLSFLIQERALHHLIDSRFNRIATTEKDRRRYCGIICKTQDDILDLIRMLYRESYFLHFAGDQRLLSTALLALRPLSAASSAAPPMRNRNAPCPCGSAMIDRATLFNQGISALNSRDIQKAEDCFRRILQSDQTDVPALNLLTVILM